MAVVLFNPTNENMEATYGGQTFRIPKFPQDGHLIRVDDNKGNHILNQLGPRGLTSLDYGDEGDIKEKKAKDGIKRNRDFKLKQVMRYNQDNEQRKATQRIYVDPPAFIKEYAKELGVGLLAPYEVADVKNEEIAELKKQAEKRDIENTELRNQVKDLMETVKELLGKVGKTSDEKEAEAKQQFIDETIAEYKRMNRNVFRPKVENLGAQEFAALPLEVQTFVSQRWGGFFEKEEAPFPY